MSNNATVKEHPLAHILRAIADGVPVQGKWNSDADWWDFNPLIHCVLLNSCISWRIKPKPKVKKWRWVIGYLDQRENNKYIVTGAHYTEEAVKTTFTVVVEKVDSTMIEVDAD